MRIILKPMGAATILAVILCLSVLLVLTLRTSKATAEKPPLPVGSEPSAAVTDGVWRTDTTAGAVERTQVGMAQSEMHLPDSLAPAPPANAGNGSYSVTVHCSTLGTTSPFPKYGILILGQEPGDRVEAWIDPRTHVLATRSYVAHTEHTWRNSPLPSGFRMDEDHVLKVAWSDQGRKVVSSVDADPAGTQEDTLTSAIQPVGFGLLSEDAIAKYHAIKVNTAH